MRYAPGLDSLSVTHPGRVRGFLTHFRLGEVLNRCRAAVLGAEKLHAEVLGVTHRGGYSEPPQPTVIDPRSVFATAEAIAATTAPLSRGAAALWSLLHSLALETALERNYSRSVSWVVFSVPQSLVCRALGYTDRHVRRLQGELELAGLLDSAALADEVQGQNLWATTLWAIRVTEREIRPRLTPDDYRHEWRDFALDLKRKNTVSAMLSGLKPEKEYKWKNILFHCVVKGIFSLNPVTPSFRPDIHPRDVQDAIYRLGTLSDSPSAGEVGAIAAALASGLGDGHSFRWWCSRLWRVAGSWEGIGQLQAQLQRVLADLHEYQGIKNIGAWTNARLS